MIVKPSYLKNRPSFPIIGMCIKWISNIILGLIVLLVHASVFKTAWEARAVSAGFDSQAVPPNTPYIKNLNN
jgi:hypothetical protein